MRHPLGCCSRTVVVVMRIPRNADRINEFTVDGKEIQRQIRLEIGISSCRSFALVQIFLFVDHNSFSIFDTKTSHPFYCLS